LTDYCEVGIHILLMNMTYFVSSGA